MELHGAAYLRTFVVWFVATVLTITGMSSTVVAQLQPIGDLPRNAYYLGRDFFRMGNIPEAMDRFESTLNVATQTSTDGWIDSIPALVMLGECYFQQGNLTKALEQYDAAVSISIGYPAWLDQFNLGDVPATLSDPAAKGLNWFRLSQPTRSMAIPGSVQLMADLTRARADGVGNVVAPVFMSARLDSTEVLRTLGIALVRRWQILGPLAPHSRLTEPAIQQFSYNLQQPHSWAQASWIALGALAKLSRDEELAINPLRSSTYTGNQFDYFMSPLCLLVQGQLAAARGQYQAAIVHFQDASVLSAQYDQFETMAETMLYLGDAACANERIDLIDSIGRAAAWTSKRSAPAHVACLSSAAELTLRAGNPAEAKKIAARLASAVRPRSVTLPRVQARLAYVEALLALRENNSQAAWNLLGDAMALMRGNSDTGPIPSRTFQKQHALNILASGQLTQADADRILTAVLAEPSRTGWELQPLETLATLTTPAKAAYIRWLQTGDGQDAAGLTARMDRIQQEQLYEALPLAGQQFAWQMAITTPINQLPEDVRPAVLGAVQRSPVLQNLPQEIAQTLQQIRQAPLPMDDRQVKADARQKFIQLEALTKQFDHVLLAQTLSRQALRRFAPNGWDLTKHQPLIQPGDLLVSFVMTGDEIYAVAISNTQVDAWRVADTADLRASILALYQQIGLIRAGANRKPIDVLSSSAKWRETAEQLYATLFSANCQSMMDSAERLIVVPHGFLWYVPFELLTGADKEPLVAHHAITYAPTLGSFSLAYASRQPIADSLSIVGNFFSLDKVVNTQEAMAVANARMPTAQIPLNQKISASSSFWLQSRIDELVVLDQRKTSADGWAVRPIGIDGKPGTSLSDWLRLPQATPDLVILPGIETSIRSGDLAAGNDLFLPACGILYGGSRGIVSRWAVGGLSSSRYLQRARQELASQSTVSGASRRATLALWAEQFNTSEEPVLRPPNSEATPLTSGEHPLLWSSYMAIGDWWQ